MMKKQYVAFCWLAIISTTSLALSIDDIRWIAQDYVPYSYVDNNAKKKGVAIEIVGELLGKTGASKSVDDIEIQTFSRSFIRRNNDKNTAFFPLAKLAGREKYFKWVGPIALDEPVLFAKKSRNINITGEEDLKRYTIAVRDEYDPAKSLKHITQVIVGSSDLENLEKLKNDQVDMIICNRLACEYTIKNNNMSLEAYDIVYKMDKSELSIAFNKDTDDKIIKQVLDAFEILKQSGRYEEILAQYDK